MGSHEAVMVSKVVASPPTSQASWVRVQASHSVVLPSQAGRCSLVGQVKEVGRAVENLSAGDRVIALAPPAASVILAADSCQKLRDVNIVTETMAFWPLVLVLMPAIRLSQLEIGERVLVLSSDLVGHILADSAWLAGAMSCVAHDPAYVDAGGSDSHTESSIGPLWVEDSLALEAVSPAKSVDLLIDASGDPARLQANLARVRDGGRVLMAGCYDSSRFDFDVYPDLHKRSLQFVSYELPTSLEAPNREKGQQSPYMSDVLGFVRNLFETGRLSPSTWPTTHLRAPDQRTIIQALQAPKRNTYLIEW